MSTPLPRLIKVFATANEDGGGRPFALVADRPDAEVPHHPHGGTWAYWLTAEIGDPIFNRLAAGVSVELLDTDHLVLA